MFPEANADPKTQRHLHYATSSAASNVSGSSFEVDSSEQKGINLTTHIDWNRIPGCSISRRRKRPRTGWVWEHGFDIEKDETGRRFWLCKACHRRKTATPHMYDAASTSQTNGHMEDTHRINKDGPMALQRKRQRTLIDMVGLDCRQPKDQASINAFVASFEPARFQQLLVRWVACDDIPFHKIESPYFRDLMVYTNSAITDSGSLPTHSTMREWIIRSFNHHKGVVTELLGLSLSRIDISFGAWSSRMFTSLLGLTSRTFLLGLPRIEGRHSGENLADRVSEIIQEYNIEGRIAYFVTDNAESNDTCLDHLAVELGFDKQQRRLRCGGHIINLVARSILFGTDADAFEEDCQAEKDIEDDVRLWRAKVYEHVALGPDDHTTYDVVTDNGTRWNSSEAMMERGRLLRNALDSLVQAEVTDWDQYVRRRTQNGARPMPKKSRKRPAVDDKTPVDDWSVIAKYLAILKPLKIATKRLEGRPKAGKFRATLERSLNFGMSEMRNPIYGLAATKRIVLPTSQPLCCILCSAGQPLSLNGRIIQIGCLEARRLWRKLWNEYRNLAVEPDAIPEQPTAARRSTELDDFMSSVRKLSTQPAPFTSARCDEYAEWVATTDTGDCLVDDTIHYILRARAISSEPERIFCLAGQMVTTQRGRLKADNIAAAQCISFWEKSEVI
ncbi:hypothetical protein LLEC1_06175 [Akanthomyces lecanii]|uniref:BED-type domain-containing protein n=1 Tax=Cordyceps confragosa TaxID=2714763 RepID=A0A179IKG2_CORDF|nr:hypothetical protein LLEC1_06175 [Akanthomyces lecanii]